MEDFPVAYTWLLIFTIVFSHLTTSVFPLQILLNDVAINCGCLSNSTAVDGRHWIGESPLLRPKGNSRSSISAHKGLIVDPTPYLTARLSFSYFFYFFQVNPGQKFIRLHFCPEIYQGFENSQDFFTVQANSFTLLQNFSATLAADALGVNYIVKEYCLNVNETGNLQITFFAASQRSRKTGNTFAFVNGIEIISMPTGLYYTPDDNLGPRIVGESNRFHYIDNRTALELVKRLNVGGGTISTVDDNGLFRKWIGDDADYLQESDFQHMNHLSATENTVYLPFVAPPKIYQTSRKLRNDLQLEDHFTWRILVDFGFSYLLRLHFSFFGIEIPEGGLQNNFSILIQNLVVETQVNAIQISDGKNTAMYKDYLVMMKGDKSQGKNDLYISLRSFDQLILGLLKGIEVFKLSNTENSLASPNPSGRKHTSPFWTSIIRRIFIVNVQSNDIINVVTIFLVIVNSCVYILRRICEYTFWEERNVQSTPVVQSVSNGSSYYRFSLAEILLATQNFSETLVIGHGGFGKVYKAIIHGRSEVLAVKRLKHDSKQGAREFWSEIETLSKLRHVHLVSLLGYCNEKEKMILVYEYMPRGTLADNLYKSRRDGTERIPLTWEQRLRICIGAARGLDYLHTGTDHGVLHCDVKDTNILLNENFVAKVSDFGLSRIGNISGTHDEYSLQIKGTFGYIDPYYILTHKHSTKSDVYAFGIVMLVVLSGRPAVERTISEETKSLLDCYRESMTNGVTNEIIDPHLQGEILTRSLERFLEAIRNCLHNHPKRRPTMAQVVAQLENALDAQIRSVRFTFGADDVDDKNSSVESTQPFDFTKFKFTLLPEESIISLPDEGNTIQKSLSDPLQIRGATSQSKGKDCNVTQKPLWAKPWIVFRKFRKPTKKMDPTLQGVRAFSLKDIKLATKNFSDKFYIGTGGLAKVYKGFINYGSGIVAIKRYSSWGAEEFQTEVQILSTIHHTHIVPFVGSCNESNELIVVYEYMPCGSLANHIYRNNGIQKNIIFLNWEERLNICIGVARGLNYLHEVGVIHRDIKDHNILLDENFAPKISGFGLSKQVSFQESKSHIITQIVGTPGYLDPSYYVSSRLTKASDVYSFGIVLMVILSGMPAIDFSRPKEHHHVKSWFEACYEEGSFDGLIDPRLVGGIPSASLGKFIELIKNCLHKDQKARPIMAQVVENLEDTLILAQMNMDESYLGAYN